MEPLTRIAYIDDDPDIREIVCFALRDIGGFEVRAWGDGASFLDDLGDWLPQLVLLDLMMPGMDGWETVAALHAHPKGGDVPVVLLSGAAETVGAATFLPSRSTLYRWRHDCM